MHKYARLGTILSGAAVVGYGGYKLGANDPAPVDGQAPGAPAANAPAGEGGIRYERWQDPREKAFTIEVPVGWRTEGGVFRTGAADIRRAWATTSPDGAVYVSGGDSEIPPFTVPNQTLAIAGYSEGAWWAPTQSRGERFLIRRYMTGVEFASDYVTGKFRGSCADFAVLDRRERPDAVAELNQLLSQFGSRGLSVRVEAGEVRFTCNSGGRPLEGYFLAATQRVSNELFAMWSVPHLYGYLAPPAQAKQAQAVLERMLASFELDQDWSDKQDEENRQTSHELKLENTVIMGILRRSWDSRDPDQVISGIH